MVADSAAQLRLLAAEVRAEQGRIGRTVAELTAAVDALGRPDATRLQLCGAAALQRAVWKRLSWPAEAGPTAGRVETP